MSRALILNQQLCINKTTIGATDSFTVANADEIGIQISFNGVTDAKINFMGSSDKVSWYPIEGVATDKKDTFITSTTRPQIYSFEVPTHNYFRAEIESIIGGSISIFATAFTIS